MHFGASVRLRPSNADLLRFAYFAANLIAYFLLFTRYFPNAHGGLGHDYLQVFPALLDGARWFWENGLTHIR